MDMMNSREDILLPEEEDLLLNALQQNGGNIYKLKDGFGSYLCMHNKSFQFKDLNKRNSYLDAFDTLLERKMIKYEAGVRYRLNTKGRKTAESITSHTIR